MSSRQRNWRTPALAVGLLLAVGAAGWGAQANGGSPKTQSGQGSAKPTVTLPPPRPLYEQERIHFSLPMPVSVGLPMKCDQNGNIYIEGIISSMAMLRESVQGYVPLPFERFSPDSATITEYALPPIADYQQVERIDYDVTPWGAVYFLLAASHSHEHADFFVAKFKDDGTLDTVTKLDEPPEGHLEPYHLAAFPHGGELLVTGDVILDWVNHVIQPFTGIYGDDGRLVTEVKIPGTKPYHLRAASLHSAGGTGQSKRSAKPEQDILTTMMQGEVIGAPDGNLYFLWASHPPILYAMSPAGEVVSQTKVKIHLPGLDPSQMSLAGTDTVLIEFNRLPGIHPTTTGPSTVFALVDLATGQVTETFRSPTGPGVAFLACATSEGDFEFLGPSEQGKLDVIDFAAQ
jgi:hypothetical protein